MADVGREFRLETASFLGGFSRPSQLVVQLLEPKIRLAQALDDSAQLPLPIPKLVRDGPSPGVILPGPFERDLERARHEPAQGRRPGAQDNRGQPLTFGEGWLWAQPLGGDADDRDRRGDESSGWPERGDRDQDDQAKERREETEGRDQGSVGQHPQSGHDDHHGRRRDVALNEQVPGDRQDQQPRNQSGQLDRRPSVIDDEATRDRDDDERQGPEHGPDRVGSKLFIVETGVPSSDRRRRIGRRNVVDHSVP